jgi:hypothetical protein
MVDGDGDTIFGKMLLLGACGYSSSNVKIRISLTSVCEIKLISNTACTILPMPIVTSSVVKPIISYSVQQ